MEPRARQSPYIWITTLAKYLADPNACGYAAWYPSNFRYAKTAFNNEHWRVSHQAFVDQQAQHLRDLGYVVTAEYDNDFCFRGPSSGTIVAGRPDLIGIAQQHGRATIRECKTGAPRPEHVIQGRLYLLLASYARPELSTLSTTATVVYISGAEMLVPAVDADFRLQLREAVAELAGPTAMEARPSLQNCRFCSVPDCAVRIQTNDLALDAHDLFD